MRHREPTTRHLPGILLLVATLASCARDDAPGPADAGGGRVSVTTASLAFADISDVVWTITVTTSDGTEVVWSETIRSTRTGDGKGAATWIGPCDAQAGMNRVTLELVAIEGPDGEDVGDYVDPTPVSRDVPCLPNADALVAFDIVVARGARQGFFDIAVDLEDVFCSAKLDCLDDEDEPLELLFDGPERGPTVVVAWACTAGANEPSYVHMDDLVFACSDGTEVVHDPGAGPGNVGAGPSPYLFQRAVYRTREALVPYAKCAWAHAFGLDLDALAAADPAVDCSIHGKATVSPDPWPLGFSRPDTTWPFIAWDVEVIADGALACTRHALDDPESGVATRYTTLAGGEHFANSMTCAPDLPIERSVACGGDYAHPDGVVGMKMVDATHLQVRIGDAVSAPLPLPAGATLTGCCLDDCCAPGP